MRQLSSVIGILLAHTVFSLRVLQVSDFHLDVDYDRKGDPQKMCHVSTPTRGQRPDDSLQLGSYGDYMCDSPESLVKFTMDETVRVSNSDGKLDLVLWTGDNTPHIDGYDEDYVVNAIIKTTGFIKAAFPNTPVLPTFGNHDYSPANAFDANVTLYERSFELWRDVILGAENEQLFKRGGYYYYDFKGARILVLNTNLYYNVNNAYPQFADPSDPAGQFAFMEDTLEAASKCDTKKTDCFSTVHIVTHIAPGVFERTPNFTWYRPEYNKRFLDITKQYASTIGWMIFGHHHTDTFHVVRDDAGLPIQTLLMAPSVTPWFSSLPGAGSNNPAFRLFDCYEDQKQSYREITTYAVDLTRLNAGKQPEFAPLYAHTLEYQMAGLGPKDFDDLIYRMEGNDNLFYKYIANNAVLVDLNMPVEPYRSAQFCSMKYADFDSYYKCMGSSSALSLYSTLSTVLLLIYLVL